jgi:hypothetical protein
MPTDTLLHMFPRHKSDFLFLFWTANRPRVKLPWLETMVT